MQPQSSKYGTLMISEIWDIIINSEDAGKAAQNMHTHMGRGLAVMLRAHFQNKELLKISRIPSYEKNAAPEGLAESNLRQESGRLYDILFNHPNMDDYRRDDLLAMLLSSIDRKDAYFVEHIIEADPGSDFTKFEPITREWIFQITEKYI